MLKRTVDIIVAAIALIALGPIIIAIWFGVIGFLGRPAIFVQERPGKDGQLFRMRKFRSMTQECDSNGNLLTDAERLTSFGRLLRSTSLDELPSLWSVVRGDMSLVGPRPLLQSYLPLYNARQARRHEVRPGITGWAQVNGRNSLSWDEKFELDVWYVENQTFLLDIKILVLTIIRVFQRSGINAEGEATMSKFTGSSK